MKTQRAWLFDGKVDLRFGKHHLLSICLAHGLSPDAGDVVLFTNQRRSRVKILFIANQHLWLLQRSMARMNSIHGNTERIDLPLLSAQIKLQVVR